MLMPNSTSINSQISIPGLKKIVDKSIYKVGNLEEPDYGGLSSESDKKFDMDMFNDHYRNKNPLSNSVQMTTS